MSKIKVKEKTYTIVADALGISRDLVFKVVKKKRTDRHNILTAIQLVNAIQSETYKKIKLELAKLK